MYSLIFSSRFNENYNRSTNPLFRLLQSFKDNTTKEERNLTEFLIKFDDDDKNIPTQEELDSFGLNIQKFVWGRHGGRGSLHEVQNILYKFADKRCKFVQFIADDFVFTRPNFVSEILEYSDKYVITGQPGMTHFQQPPGTHGYCPAFSAKVIDALSCTTGPHSNGDGVVCGIADALREKYDYEIMFSPGGKPGYYLRTDCETSSHDSTDYFTALTGPTSDESLKGNWRDYWNIFRSMIVDSIGGISNLQSIILNNTNK